MDDPREKLLDKFLGITRFIGSLEEYERFRGYECEIMAPILEFKFECTTYCGEIVPYKLKDKQKKMLEEGLEAVVRYQPKGSSGNNFEQGIPVRRKRGC